MAEIQGKKKRLSINLSFLTPTDTPKQTSPQKSSKNFESPNGVVGLGILAALNDDENRQDSIFIKPRSRNSILITSPSNPSSVFDFKKLSKNNCGRELSAEEMEVCEEYYTCVISHVGENLIKKREYFEANLVRNDDGSDSSVKVGTGDFLYSCFLCEKLLHGLDIFMYRGEKAFCSAECRYHQISIDEQKEKRRSGLRKTKELSVSPCSGRLQFFAGVAAA